MVLFLPFVLWGVFVVLLNEDIHGGKTDQKKAKKLNCSLVYCRNNELSSG